MSVSMLIGTVAAIAIGSCLLESLFFSQRNPQEPAYVRPRIPLIGHLIGISAKGTQYYSDIAATQPVKIFSLPIFSFKFYVVAERRLFGPIQRNARTLSFSPFSRRATKVMSHVSEETLSILDDPATGDVGGGDFHRVVSSSLATGADLDRLLLETMQEKLKFVDDLVTKSADAPVEMDLFVWIKHVITMAATRGIYGPQNPYHDPKQEVNFWTYHDKILWIVTGLSWIFAPKAERAREEMIKKYEAYFQTGGNETASRFIKERSRILRDNGAPARDLARINVGNDTAIISNYVPTSFWVAFNVLSRPQLLADIRKEVTRAVINGGDNGNDFTLDISLLRTACPLILSTFQETQRLFTATANIREVMTDTTISAGDEQFLLKKGNYVQLASKSSLRSTEVWGEDADTFDPYRFIKMKKDGDGDGVVPPSQLPSHSFPVWGIAPHLCPARWYASTGVLSLVALMVLRLDISPAGVKSGDASWETPRFFNGFSAILQPSEPLPVSVQARKEWMGTWGMTVGTPNTRIQLSVA